MAAGRWPRSPPLLIVWLLLHPGSLSASEIRFGAFPDQITTSVTPLHEAQVASGIQCAILCKLHGSCGAFSHSSSSVCQLLPQTAELCQPDTAAALLTADAGGMVGTLCPLTCLQLKRQVPSAPSGLYRLRGWPVPVLCDQDLDGGGWTLILASVSQTWTPDGSVTLVTGRNEQSPNISADYSILARGDHLISLGTGDRFVYRLEGLVDTAGRQQWGGIWSVSRAISSVVRHAPDVTSSLVTRFGDWVTGAQTIEDRLPWINLGYFVGYESLAFVLTTSADHSFWGTLITRPSGYRHSPWLQNIVDQSGHVLYWIREDETV